jgi:hypothetical protein
MVASIADLYQLVDQADVSVEARINGVLLTQMESCSWSFAIAKVPTATIRLAGAAPGVVAFFADVRIDAGFNGQTTRVFTGKVMHVNPDELGVSIECQGMAFALDDPYHKVVTTLSNITAQNAITDLLIAALVPNYVVNMPAWTIGTVVVQTLTFQTYSEAINKISEVDGARWMEFPTGQIRVQPLDPVPSLTAWRKYFSMRLTGTAEAYPTGVTSADGRPRLRRMRGEQQIRDVKNRCFVRGAVVDQTNADGTVSPIDIEGDAQATSPWVLNPDGTQAYNDELFSNELIDQASKAGSVAARIVAVKNRLNTRGTAVIDGDPELALGRTVYIGDPDYTGIEANFFVESYVTAWTQDDFVSTITLIGGENAGGAVNISPFALFTYVAEREVVGNAVKAILTLDGRGSIDPDGSIVSWSWTDNQTPNLVSGSGQVVTVLVDLAALVTPFIVTLTVTDNDGATDSISLTVTLDAGATNVALPAIYVAGDTYFTASPDGGQTWSDQAVPGGESCISVGAKPGDGTTAGVGMYGTSGGKVYRSTDFCATAPTLVLSTVGAIVAFGNSFWQTGLCWCVTQQGVLYRSDDDGATWAVWNDLRFVFGKPAFRANQILTPREGGVWVLGGDGEGRPVVAFDPSLTHAWGQLPLGGELLLDLLTNPVATDLYVRQWGIGGDNQNFAILLNSATYPTAVYWSDDVLGDGSAWKRAVGLPAKTQGRWMTGDYGATSGQFQFGFNDRTVYLGDITAGVMNITTAAGDLDAGDVPNHGIAIGGLLGGIAGAHIVAAEGATDGTLYKTWDRFTTDPVQKLRPATGFGVPPAGWNAKMVTLSASGGPSVIEPANVFLAFDAAGGGISLRQWRRKQGTNPWEGGDLPAALWATRSGLPPGYMKARILKRGLWYVVPFTGDTDEGTPDFSGWRSVDEGATWAEDPELDAIVDYAKLANGDIVKLIKVSFGGASTSDGRVKLSTDDGASFSTLATFDNHTVSGERRFWHRIAPHPNNQLVFAIGPRDARNGGDAFRWGYTVNGGGSFTETQVGTGLVVAHGMPMPEHEFVMLASGRIVALVSASGAVADPRIYTSDDGGATWTLRYSDPEAGVPVDELRLNAIAYDGISDLIVLRETDSTTPDSFHLLGSTDQGVTWAQIGPDLPMNGAATPTWENIAYDPETDTAYAMSDTCIGLAGAETHFVARLTPCLHGTPPAAWEDISNGIKLGIATAFSSNEGCISVVPRA